MENKFDFYDKTSLKSYNLNESMRYQLNILDSLDVFTRKHCENVANLTCRICEHLHCKKDFTQYCTICAYLHDIGKIFIPPEILQKPGKLTSEEYEKMKTHTTFGHKMCMNDLQLRPYAAGPLYHHEALNGTGYPQGLTKNDIPYEAQIIRVADEYDAIVSKRQYKSHIEISDTLKILIENTKPLDSENYQTDKTEALNIIMKHTKLGKNNPIIVKALFKVIIEDIEYEISYTQDYVDELGKELKRFKQINMYQEKANTAKKEKDYQNYIESMKMLFKNNESINNYKQIESEYESAYETRKNIIDNLYSEIKIVKKLK